MANQKKILDLELKIEEKIKIGKILDLEKKYFNILWELFKSKSFINDLEMIEREIKKKYSFLQKEWELKNKIKVPAERLVRQHIYRNLSDIIKNIYPSPISSDIAFITNDAVINIDIKTIDIIGNKNDIKTLQFENNQSSFKNKKLDSNKDHNNSGVVVECLLDTYYQCDNEELPILTYFLIIIYYDDGKEFKLNDNDLETIYLKCLPNGGISILFDYDIVSNFKTYSYLEEKHGVSFIRKFLTDYEKDLNIKLSEIADQDKNFSIIKGRRKIGLYNEKQIHPKYGTNGVSWFPVLRKNKKSKNNNNSYYLEAVHKGNTTRVTNEILLDRYDSNNEYWEGVKKIKI